MPSIRAEFIAIDPGKPEKHTMTLGGVRNSEEYCQ
jgi:hypothetical protein